MKNNRGITLISLVSAVILLVILSTITVSTSIDLYNKMRFESAKAELEEVQKLMEKIVSDYKTYLAELGENTELEDEENYTYEKYFETRYGNKTVDFSGMLLSAHSSDVEKLKNKHNEIENAITNSSKYAFYFTGENLFKYFGLKGINDVVIDFSTKKVYSVNGIVDSKDISKIYYTPTDWGAKSNIEYTPNTTNTTISLNYKGKSDTIYDVELIIEPKLTNKISEIYYYSDDNNKKIKIDNWRDITSYSDTFTTLRLAVEGQSSKTYKFKVIDEFKNIYENEEFLPLEGID